MTPADRKAAALGELARAVRNIRNAQGPECNGIRRPSLCMGVHLYCARLHLERAWAAWVTIGVYDVHLRRRILLVQRLVDSFSVLLTLGVAA